MNQYRRRSPESYKYLIPNVACKTVVMPNTKKVVFMTSLMSELFTSRHMAEAKKNGVITVATNMTR